MNTPTPTPRPALKATGMRRRHARCLETKLAALTAERDQLRAEVKSCGELSCDECNARTAALTTERDQLRADNSTLRAAQKACEACDEPTAFEVQQLRAALALGQQNCDDAYDDLRAERAAANARAERAEAELATERARLKEMAAELAHCAGYIASVRTDRLITWHEELYALQTLEWAEGAFEIAEKANAVLEAHDAAMKEDAK